jgi:hypothetical protein
LALSNPLTVCLAVLGRRLPTLEVWYVLLGADPVLTPEVRYYERLLAFDEDEAAEVLETYLKDKSLVELYDSVLIPALALVEWDRRTRKNNPFLLTFLRKRSWHVPPRSPLVPNNSTGFRLYQILSWLVSAKSVWLKCAFDRNHDRSLLIKGKPLMARSNFNELVRQGMPQKTIAMPEI